MQKAIDTSPSTPEAQRIRLALCLLAAAVMAVTFFSLADSVLRDPDNWWHVRVGLDMLASRSFPTTDTYSHSFAGHPWIAKEWLGQILLALAYKAGGWNGVALLTIVAIALTIFLLAWYLSADLRPTVAVGLVAILAFLVSPTYNARPYIFTFPIIVIWTAHFYRASRREEAPPFWLLPLLALWANLHAAFPFAFVIAFLAFLDLFERVRFSRRDLLTRWVLFGIACPFVTLLNPYGINVVLVIFDVASGNEGIPILSEWRPFNAGEQHFHEAGLLLLLFGLLVSGLRLGWARALLVVFTLHLFLLHYRLMYLFLLLVPLAVSADIALQYPMLSARTWVGEKRDRLEHFFATRTEWMAAVMAVPVAFSALISVGLQKVEPSPKTFAEGALGFAREQNLSGNVLNSFDLGGTLIFHGIKTFIDGRTDQLFMGGFMKMDAETRKSAGKPLLKRQLEDYSISWALLAANDGRIAFFNELAGWQLAYKDQYAVIYVRKESTQQP